MEFVPRSWRFGGQGISVNRRFMTNNHPLLNLPEWLPQARIVCYDGCDGWERENYFAELAWFAGLPEP